MFDFVSITFVDILDIILVGLLIFQIIRLILGTAAMSILPNTHSLCDMAGGFAFNRLSFAVGQVLGVCDCFNCDFPTGNTSFSTHLAQVCLCKQGSTVAFSRIAAGSMVSPELLEELTEACRMMSQENTGALIVLKHRTSLAPIIETGDEVDARISRRLLLNIFFKNSPLHDGALIIANERIQAVRCTLPISANPNSPAQYGLRHKAAVGITEQTDASAIVVSEETGIFRLFQMGT